LAVHGEPGERPLAPLVVVPPVVAPVVPPLVFPPVVMPPLVPVVPPLDPPQALIRTKPKPTAAASVPRM
jgi:hypothetical protein